MTIRKLVDSCVLVYAYETNDVAKHEEARDLLFALVEDRQAAVSIQNLAEFSRVMTEKSPVRAAPELVRGYVNRIALNYHVLPYNEKTVESALLLSAATRTHFFDALLAATMQENGIYEIITENAKDFKRIPWIRATSPFRGRKG